jgi:disulfide bond formation protein DsbB
MNLFFSNKPLLFICASASFALLGYGLYLQHVLDMAPCPYCILQRYAFAAVGIAALCGALSRSNGFIKAWSGLAALAALTGTGLAIYLLYVQSNPSVSCGIDPMETALNKILPALWLPSVFKAEGLCSAQYPPILGLSIAQWALVWFVVFSIALIVGVFKRSPRIQSF